MANNAQRENNHIIKFNRYFFDTKLFDQTKSLPLVQEKLGHRNINSTMVYTHLVEFDEDSQNYYHSVARDEKDAGDLIDKRVPVRLHYASGHNDV